MQMRLGRLRLVDPDLVSLGNAVRWPLGFAAAGLSKAIALHRLAEEHYPETRVQSAQWLAGADLVIDATAELGVQLFLADLARTRGFPLLTVEAREGGYAGAVVRYDPARPGCYHCFKEHQADGRFVLPRDATTGVTQPRGCAAPTFTGAAFDLVPVAALAARVTAQTLLRPAFGDAPYDIALLFNRTDDAGTIGETPRWEIFRLEPNARCPSCSPR
jgi:molybdopterin/thiamine biosynthesis adenylyltransferase